MLIIFQKKMNRMIIMIMIPKKRKKKDYKIFP
jgi:hypothetical protein